MRKLVLLLLFFTGSTHLFMARAQKVYLSPALHELIASQCLVCNQSAERTDSQLAVNFHRCHEALNNGNLDEGFKYAATITAAADSNSLAPILLTTRFLKAKVLYYKSLNNEALSEYYKLIRISSLNQSILSSIYPNIAEIYIEQGAFKTALAYLDTVQHRFFHLYEPSVSRKILNNTGVCLIHLKRYKEAEDYFDKSIAIAAALKDTTALTNTYLNVAIRYDEQDMYAQARNYFEKALALVSKSSDLVSQSKVYVSLASFEERYGRLEQALEYRKTYERLEKEIADRDNVWAMAEQDKKIAVQQQEYRVQLLQKENRLREAELSKRKWQRNMSLILAILFFSFSGFIYVAYRQKNKRNRIIAEQKDKLELLNQTKDQLFSIVAHDLRSPVHHLKINLSYLKESLSQNRIREATSLSENIEKISDNTYALLNNLLYWALGQTGQLSLRREKLDLRPVIEQVCYDFNSIAALKRISIVNQVPGGINFYADINSIKIVFRNLLDNAIKYTHVNGTITFSARVTGDMCEVTVQDTGMGMDERIIKAIQQNESRRIQQDTGGNRSTGLGLWLVKNMSEKNGGSLQISSVSGQGTSVVISLPVKEQYEGPEGTYS
ncbi:ATP-binding protein [Chitinophaga tropicalis]|uniref:histidine kinase n=1 Tax=Chitinophaga tropicalis TaxID=2683588 RepID=A0A7K1U281_9BACT|nr:ATP-binding protein [Chitinophaga tropicalis]MVT08484.1 tetratricopeptide repeat protein [Chitinophaga tropicalis]